jgi:hypothetical protein
MLNSSPRTEKHRRLLAQYTGDAEIEQEFMGLHRYVAATDQGLWVVGMGAHATGEMSGRMVKCYPWAQISSIELRMSSMQAYIEITSVGMEPARRGTAHHLAENVVLVGMDRRSKQRTGDFIAYINSRIADYHSRRASGPTKQCPYCAETILEQAIKCKHCGSELAA